MKTPRWTDAHRFPNGYRKAAATDIRATFKRVRQQMKDQAEQAARDAAEAKEKTVPMRKVAR